MSVAIELTSGAVAGVAGILTTQPLDTIRIRLQSPALGRSCGGAYKGFFDCASATYRAEGFRGLYKGIAAPTLAVGAVNAVVFFSYECASEALRRRSRHLGGGGRGSGDALTVPQTFVAGSASGFASAFVSTPAELMKCIAQVNVKSQGRIYDDWLAFRSMIKDHGWLGAHGPYRGMFITMCRDMPSYGLYFSVYEASIGALGKSQFNSFMAGGFAGVLTWALIYPIDVIKTRWQTAPPGKYASFGHCVRSTFRPEARKTWLRGFGASLARAWPQSGVVFCTYEMVKDMLTK